MGSEIFVAQLQVILWAFRFEKWDLSIIDIFPTGFWIRGPDETEIEGPILLASRQEQGQSSNTKEIKAVTEAENYHTELYQLEDLFTNIEEWTKRKKSKKTVIKNETSMFFPQLFFCTIDES